jgi:hypothetical protein
MPYRTQFATVRAVCQTVRMTNQQPNQQPRPPHREDYKVQKLVDRIESKLALQAKAIREAIAPGDDTRCHPLKGTAKSGVPQILGS